MIGKALYYWSKFLKKARGSALIDCMIHSSSTIESGCNLVSVVMDKYSFCGYNCEIVNCNIGSYCSIANNVIIGGATHPMTWASMSPVFYAGRDSVKKKFSSYQRANGNKIVIGHDVWIGDGVHIKQGVNVGTGSVIGMGSVVTKDVPPYAIVAGNPAAIIRMRFSPEIIDGLLSSRWWELDDKKIQACAAFVKEPHLFIEEVNRIKSGFND